MPLEISRVGGRSVRNGWKADIDEAFAAEVIRHIMRVDTSRFFALGSSLSVPDIFISYARADAKVARRFADAFAAEGFEVWWDAALQTGEVFDEAIEAALNAAKAVVVLWSPESVVSRWVRAEATVADNNNTLLPVTIKPCRRPVIFELTQTADLSRWKGNRKDPAWRAVVEDVRKLIAGEAHRSEEWQTKGRAGTAPRADGLFGRFRYPLVAALMALLLLVAGIWWNPMSETASDEPLRIAAFQAPSRPQAAQFAQELRGDLIDTMAKAGFPATTDDASASSGSRTGMLLSGSIAEADGKLKIFAQIQDSETGVTVWSQQFEGATSNADELSTAIAVAAAEPLYQLREINLQNGLKLDPTNLANLMKGMQMINNPRRFDEGMLSRAWGNVAAKSPRTAYAHANFALALVQDAARSRANQRPALFAHARSEADIAFKISPAASGGGYDALYLMSVYTEPGKIIRQEDRLLEGLQNAPEFPYLSMRECQFLMSVGRNDDAWIYCQRAHAIRPLTAPIEWRFAEALKMRGEPTLAEQAIDQAVIDHPENRIVRLANFDILAFGGAPDRAAALLPEMLNQGEGFGDNEIAALKSYLLARKSGKVADAERATVAITTAATEHKLRLDLAIKALVALGRIEEALGLLGQVRQTLPPQMDLAPANPGSSFLFAPETAPLRADPRFWAVAARVGLISYWMKRKWPDFCGKEVPLARCKVLAVRASSAA